MQTSRYFLLSLVLLVVGVTACYYQHPSSSSDEAVAAQSRADSVLERGVRDVLLNSNFEVLADTLWLHQLPFRDTVPVLKGDELVVAEFAVHPEDTTDSVWVKVARDQETIGWIQERLLLKNVVPVDPISRCIHLFSSSHTLPFFLVLAVFFLWFVYRAYRRKQIKLIWLNDIDSVFPITLSWLLAVAATLYNSIQHFVPQTWEHYYYDPTLNPFHVPFILSLFIVCVALIVVLGMALLDDLFHQTTVEVASFYLVGFGSCCIFLYIFFTYIWVYLAYVCLLFYTWGCIRLLWKSNSYPYACGACGAKMHAKGVCPHCGALNE